MPSSTTLSMVTLYVAKSKFVRKPRDPRAKGRTGGTIRWLRAVSYADLQYRILTRAKM